MKRIFFILCLGFASIGLWAQGYIPGPVNFHNYTVNQPKKAEVLPSKYDAREQGIVSPVRDQEVGGPCWAFAACEAVYSTFRSQGLEVEPLSPQILTNCHYPFLFESMTGGGNDQVAIALFSRGDGPVSETIIPFDSKDLDCPSYDIADIDYYALGAYYLPKNDKFVIKKEIMKHGAVVAGMYYDDASYDPTTYFHEYTGPNGSNHGVTIIGWDDAKGAWLVKNSWGEWAHDKGYLWVSYKDVNISAGCVSYTRGVPTQEIDHIYTYSSGGMTGGFGASNKDLTISGIVSFNAPAQETINYIGTYVNLAGTDLTFNVLHKGKIVYTSEPVTIPYVGYYAHPLEKTISVEGEYKIAVDYHHADGGFVLPTYGKIDNYVDCQVVPGKQWIQFKGWDWEPVGVKTNNFNLCIYAYTQDSTPTSAQEEEAGSVWANATQIRVLNLVGQPITMGPVAPGVDSLEEWLEQTSTELDKGIYILQVLDQKGNTHTEKVQL